MSLSGLTAKNIDKLLGAAAMVNELGGVGLNISLGVTLIILESILSTTSPFAPIEIVRTK